MTTTYPEEELKRYHDLCYCNRELLSHHFVQSSLQCICCLEKFTLDDIKNWIHDERYGKTFDTAICPKCEVDAVVPAPTAPPEFMEALQKRWFGKESNGS